MAVFTIPSITKGEASTISLNKNDLLALAAVSADPYFSVSTNVKSVIVEWNSDPGNQKERLLFDFEQASPQASFLVSEKARDEFVLESITLIDFDGGQFLLTGDDLPTGFDISLSGGGGGGGLPVTSGLWAYFRGGSLTLSNGDPVTSWSDESAAPSSSPMLQNASNPAPTYVASSINSLPAIRNDQIGGGSASGSKHMVMNRQFPNSHTIFLVAKAASASGAKGTLVSEQPSFGSGSTALAITHESGVLYGYYSDPFAQPSIGNVGANPFVLSTVTTAATSIVQYLNGTLAATSNGNAMNAAYRPVGSKVWLFNFFSWNFVGDIAEFIVFDRVLTTQERSDMTAYLGTKYAITVA